jgi:hypothetical protein
MWVQLVDRCLQIRIPDSQLCANQEQGGVTTMTWALKEAASLVGLFLDSEATFPGQLVAITQQP